MAPVTVRWEIAHDEKFSQMVLQGQTPAVPELAHSVHVEVAGLQPDRWYFYRFIAGTTVSPVGQARTLPGGAGALCDGARGRAGSRALWRGQRHRPAHSRPAHGGFGFPAIPPFDDGAAPCRGG